MKQYTAKLEIKITNSIKLNGAFVKHLKQLCRAGYKYGAILV